MTRLLMVSTVCSTLRMFLAPFARHFRGLGWQVDGMARGIPDCSTCVESFARVWDIDWSRNPLDFRNLLVCTQKVRNIVEREGYDLVHVHTPIAAFVSRYALNPLRKERGLKVIYTAHGFHFHQYGHPLKNAAFLALEKMAGRWTDYLVVVNKDDEMAAHRHRIVPRDRITRLPGTAIDPEFYSRNSVTEESVAEVRREIGLLPTDHLFLMIGEFNPGKRHRDAVRALAEIKRTDVHLACAGAGPLMEAVRKQADELGVGDRVHLLGGRLDVPVLLRASDGCLLPSAREGLPRSVIESICMQTPVIGTDIRGIRDLLFDGRGRMVKLGDSTAIAREMQWIIDNPLEVREMTSRAREAVWEHDLPRVLDAYSRLYARALRDASGQVRQLK